MASRRIAPTFGESWPGLAEALAETLCEAEHAVEGSDSLERIAQVLETARRFATFKAQGMRHRIAGRIPDALRCETETEAEDAYQALPESVRW